MRNVTILHLKESADWIPIQMQLQLETDAEEL